MKRKNAEEGEEKENSERWLLTYSDLITLLLALFIILYAMSSLDLEKYKELSTNLNTAFHGYSSGDGTGTGDGIGEGTGDGTSGDDTSSDIISSEISVGISVTQVSPLDAIYSELSDYIEQNDLGNIIQLKNENNYVKVTLRDTLLFVPDSAVMLEDSKPVLSEIREALCKIYDRVDHITITGHTADPYNQGNQGSAFSWELSLDRATTVLNYMAEQGLPENKLSIEGYSHFEPVAANTTEEGRAQNRRVEITIFKDTTEDTASSSSEEATSSTEASSNEAESVTEPESTVSNLEATLGR